MHILQAGIPKSGNSWIFSIVTQILKRSATSIKKFISQQPIAALAQQWPKPFPEQAQIDTIKIDGAHWYYTIGGAVHIPIVDIHEYIQQTTQVWTHAVFTGKEVSNLEKFSHIIYIIRDPRDAIVSHSHFVLAPHIKWQHPNVDTTPHAFVDRHMYIEARKWVYHVGNALKHTRRLNIHFVFYERLLADFDTELNRLLSFLNITLDINDRLAIKKATSFASMHQSNPYHIRRGKSGAWIEELLPYQQREISAITKEMRNLLGYPDKPIVNGNPRPQLPDPISLAVIDAAQRKSRRLTWRERGAHYSSVLKNYI